MTPTGKDMVEQGLSGTVFQLGKRMDRSKIQPTGFACTIPTGKVY